MELFSLLGLMGFIGYGFFSVIGAIEKSRTIRFRHKVWVNVKTQYVHINDSSTNSKQERYRYHGWKYLELDRVPVIGDDLFNLGKVSRVILSTDHRSTEIDCEMIEGYDLDDFWSTVQHLVLDEYKSSVNGGGRFGRITEEEVDMEIKKLHDERDERSDS